VWVVCVVLCVRGVARVVFCVGRSLAAVSAWACADWTDAAYELCARAGPKQTEQPIAYSSMGWERLHGSYLVPGREVPLVCAPARSYADPRNSAQLEKILQPAVTPSSINEVSPLQV
jgi:hypothetical protein